jgi:hypothetical protein
LPVKSERLERAASEDKECTSQGGPDVVCSEVEVIAVCWDRLKRLDEAALGRVMRYLLARSDSWHQQPSEDF